jgi:cyanophycin synthetase
MKIGEIRTIAGPNVYSHKPVLVMTLDLEDLQDVESHALPNFIERLLVSLPGLYQHVCSRGRAGGFVERLLEGTYFGHIVEHVALELSEPAGVPVSHGKTRAMDAPGWYRVVVNYTSEAGMRYLLETAVELVSAVVASKSFPLDERLQEAKHIVTATALGPSTQAIVTAAERRGIPWTRPTDNSLIRLGYGTQRKFIQAALSSDTSYIAVEIVQDKELTKTLLRQAMIPVPHGIVVRTSAEAVAALASLQKPVVVKPLDGNQGKGVSLDLRTPEQVQEALRLARQYSAAVLVEELFTGQDYRAVVVNGTLVAASRRTPAHVTGDGRQTIAALIARENADPLRGDGHDKPLSRITIDPSLLACLRRQEFQLETVPMPGQVVYLRETANLSTGGTATDVTPAVHPEIRRLCERVARTVGLDICGIDLVLSDIAAPLDGRGGVIEVNAAPGIRMHHFPSAGESRDVGAAIIDMLYPPGSASGRIPIISVTGTNGKTTVTRMISHVLAATDKTVGMTTTDGTWVGDECLTQGDNSGPQSARAVLADPTVEVAVLETARGGIVRRGLGYDWADVAVITNIQEDHIGQDGIRDIEDIVHVKSLVAERVRDGGTLILNADNEPVSRFAERRRVQERPKQVVYFSLHPHHLLIKRHLMNGGTAYVVKDGWIVEAIGEGTEVPLVEIAGVPVTWQGLADFQVANVLAAVAACRAQGVTRAALVSALQTFGAASHNVGRANLYQVGHGHVLVDYGHNAGAFAAIGSFLSRVPGYHFTGVITVPGDRAAWLIAHAGRAAARVFHRVVLWEGDDLRGQEPGTVPRLLAEAIRTENPECECQITLDQQEAMETTMRHLQEGELAVLFYDSHAIIETLLRRYKAVPVAALPARPVQQPAARVAQVNVGQAHVGLD